MIQWKGVLTTAKFSIIIPPPPLFFIIHVDHTETNKFQQYSKNVYLTAHCFQKIPFSIVTIFNCNISPKIHNLHCNTGAHSFFKSQESHFFPFLLLILQQQIFKTPTPSTHARPYQTRHVCQFMRHKYQCQLVAKGNAIVPGSSIVFCSICRRGHSNNTWLHVFLFWAEKPEDMGALVQDIHYPVFLCPGASA